MSRVRFWGVRGSVPTPDRRMLRYGGNTSCIEVPGAADERIILDAGTGLIRLSNSGAREHHIFLTHFHRDHIEGIPFFAPLHDAGHSVTFHAPSVLGSIRKTLDGFIRPPYSPVGLNAAAARIEFDEFECSTRVGGFTVHAFELNHPQRAFGYRVEHNGAALVYASDYEHGNQALDSLLRSHAAGAGVLICDTQYTPEDYEAHRGWGHSTWLEATRVAQDAAVRRLILFHHSPARTDAAVDSIVAQARGLFSNTDAAREERRVTLP